MNKCIYWSLQVKIQRYARDFDPYAQEGQGVFWPMIVDFS